MKQTIRLGGHPAIALLHAAAATVMDALRRQVRNRARRRLAQRTEQALGWVDERTLRDIGLTRSEIGSLAEEIAGDVEVTRRRIAHMHR